MTNTQLRSGNQLSKLLNDLKHGKEDIIKSLKELSLNAFAGPSIRLRIDQKECRVDTKRAIEFLEKELKLTIAEIESLEEQFKVL